MYDSTGIPIYFDDNHRPNFLITPITLIDSADFNLNFQITHHYTRLPSVPGLTSGVDFINSVRMDSYYSRNDSIIRNMPVIPNHITSPVNVNYSVSIQIDTTLMIDGFVFNYKFWAMDEGIIPEFSNSPDSGYYQCIWDTTITVIETDLALLHDFSLSQNYPNPFNPITKIIYQIPELSFVAINIYDVLGKEVATLVNEEKPLGNYEVEFNGTGLPSGIYFYRLQAGKFVEAKKMILIK